MHLREVPGILPWAVFSQAGVFFLGIFSKHQSTSQVGLFKLFATLFAVAFWLVGDPCNSSDKYVQMLQPCLLSRALNCCHGNQGGWVNIKWD